MYQSEQNFKNCPLYRGCPLLMGIH